VLGAVDLVRAAVGDVELLAVAARVQAVRPLPVLMKPISLKLAPSTTNTPSAIMSAT
jgi:hypothetical protein